MFDSKFNRGCVCIASRWPGFEFKRFWFLVLTAPAKATTTIQIGDGWWAAAAMRVGRGGGLCSNAPSLVGDLDRTTATAYANNGRSSLLGGYYYCGGVGGPSGRVLERQAWEVCCLPVFWVCFVVIPM